MKQKYERPTAQWISVRSNQAVADICWGYVSSGKQFYHDIPGFGYASLKVHSKKSGCKGDIYFTVEFYGGEDMTSQQMAAAQSYIDQVIAHVKAESSAGNPSPYHGSPFVGRVDPEWS